MIAPLNSGRDTFFESQYSGRKPTDFLLFGSQALAFKTKSFRQLRAELLDSPNCLWILRVLAELPTYWDTVIQSIPRLKSFPGIKLLHSLNEWLRTGEAPEEAFPLPNILLTPLVVLIHLIQYAKFLEINQLSFKNNHEVVGLCTGLLSAQVASSSENQGEFEEYGGVAIRLAMLYGAVVDAQDTEADPQGESKSISVAWISPESDAVLTQILKFFPEVSRAASILPLVKVSTNSKDFAGICSCCFRRETSYGDDVQSNGSIVTAAAQSSWSDCGRNSPQRKIPQPFSSA